MGLAVSNRRRRRGITLLEFITVIAILGILAQVLFPALQAARESARKLTCATHLKRIGMAIHTHQDVLGRLPSGGWHFHWVGEPERGTDQTQPGSWIFNLLDYVDESPLRRLGRGQTGTLRNHAFAERCRTPLDLFHCPSRREADCYPHRVNRQPLTLDGRMREPLDWAAKTDYAANAGDQVWVEFDWRWPGPQSLSQGDDLHFKWPAASIFTGVIFGRSRVRPPQIRDGQSKTYLVAEKYMDASKYRTGEDWGDNENLYSGFNNDVCRTTFVRPLRDIPGHDAKTAFGSAHASVWLAAFCDGSVHEMSFAIDAELHRQLGNRHDRAPGENWK